MSQAYEKSDSFKPFNEWETEHDWRKDWKVSMHQTMLFTRNLSTMLASGLDIISGLRVLEEQSHKNLIPVVQDLSKQVSSGHYLSEAMNKFPRVFSAVYVGTIRMAEASGSFVPVLKALSEQMEKEDRSRQDLFKSLTYPLIQLLVTVLMVAFLIHFMLPRFIPFFSATGEELPKLTQWVVAFSESFPVRYSPLLLLLLGIAAFRAWQDTRFRQKIVQLTYYIPGFGALLFQQSLAICNEKLALQLETGVTMDVALRTTSLCTPFPRLSEMFLRLRRGVREGQDFERLVEEETLTPPIVSTCFVVGSETGRLVPMIRLAAEILEEQVEAKKETFFQLLEPALLMFMGLAVGILVLACFLPVYQLATVNI
jgi:type II secretory pathway component PulF